MLLALDGPTVKRSMRLPLHPKHPERTCWGCEKYCPAHDLTCGNGTERTQHPAELFGEDWYEWSHATREAENGGADSAEDAKADAPGEYPVGGVELEPRESLAPSPPRGG